ncbi:hypothetical protein GGR53DRAFT_529860 [Hypoxylon sp. FL1150]|nr:hypothetical protein GGR53DRAFT_529860 [Hypoxylon sp. FL1150]
MNRALQAAIGQWRVQVVDVLLLRVEYAKVIYEMLGEACSFKVLLPREIQSRYEGDNHLNRQRVIDRPFEVRLDPDASISNEPFIHQAGSHIELWRALDNLLYEGKLGPTLDVHEFPPTIIVRRRPSMSSECRVHQKGVEFLLGRHPLRIYYAALAFGFDKFLLYLPVLVPSRLVAQRNHHCEPLLHYAAAGANVNVLELLLDHDLPINARNNNGWAPFTCGLAQIFKGVHNRGPSPSALTVVVEYKLVGG